MRLACSEMDSAGLYTSAKTSQLRFDLYGESFRIFGLSTINYIIDFVAIAFPSLEVLGRWMFNCWVQKLIVEELETRTIFEHQQVKISVANAFSHNFSCWIKEN
ncbi:hypothetical protein [Calothrix sp. NIES-2098]|uniref:hypothetical protein n=1 Tax=Calothrix sp. NIES-2098 TaxID=1954171 RepID=UPI000B5E8EF0|nr:hypothetical protein NIES2098_56240 [Calothrix sp. NIES-2098]